MASGGQQEPEPGCRCPLTRAAVAPAPSLHRETFALRFALTRVPTVVGELSKCLVVHRTTPLRVRTTFPVFCPVSTYLVAATTSSRG